jgi:ribonuclease G
MYDVDDAVAKIDGYIVSVAGAGPLVGEKRLVRIEQAGRTSATAVLLDPTGAAGQGVAGSGTGSGGDDVQSTTRRRGRRGGRRRSRATADAAGAQDS